MSRREFGPQAMMSPPQKHAIEIADELAHEAPEERVATFQTISADQRQSVFRGLAAGHQQELLERLPEEQARMLVEELDPDDRVRLFDQLPAETADALLAGLSPHEQEVTRQLLNHRPESAGRS